MDLLDHPGLIIRFARERQGLRQFEVAQMAGISESHLSRLEKNREKGRPETWRKLAAVLEIDPDKLGGRAVIAD